MWKEKTYYWTILAVNCEVGLNKSMEIFAISFLIFITASLALAISLLLGRGPIHGGCRPDGSEGGCAKKGACALPCAKRRKTSTTREATEC